ncbi:hypothetical protein SAMD00019534_096190 [Acytostelium subglobosum LB1]|uniref:hypothetical protein n=1 Tax=Acytostelium subglobosum LB1 TaxID=1410327 RepID=UPI0006449052|nr:hypothetical protein SAMD00019534_096190 [Acytostelium subglobosum LB1]GAM26444.1 hypothetical protein SAMD00019534_096190 [Acytostelium subglobosum LB1]|eukprot:XP_012750540.1 hypothetical protein SAMD00019534_096190 [Acytostelium subglobosum LB1]
MLKNNVMQDGDQHHEVTTTTTSNVVDDDNDTDNDEQYDDDDDDDDNEYDLKTLIEMDRQRQRHRQPNEDGDGDREGHQHHDDDNGDCGDMDTNDAIELLIREVDEQWSTRPPVCIDKDEIDMFGFKLDAHGFGVPTTNKEPFHSRPIQPLLNQSKSLSNLLYLLEVEIVFFNSLNNPPPSLIYSDQISEKSTLNISQCLLRLPTGVLFCLLTDHLTKSFSGSGLSSQTDIFKAWFRTYRLFSPDLNFLLIKWLCYPLFLSESERYELVEFILNECTLSSHARKQLLTRQEPFFLARPPTALDLFTSRYHTSTHMPLAAYAALFDNAKLFKILFHREEHDASFPTLLDITCMRGSSAMVGHILATQPKYLAMNPSAMPLWSAAHSGNLEVLSLLNHHTELMNCKDHPHQPNVLECCLLLGHTEFLEALFSHCPNINSKLIVEQVSQDRAPHTQPDKSDCSTLGILVAQHNIKSITFIYRHLDIKQAQWQHICPGILLRLVNSSQPSAYQVLLQLHTMGHTIDTFEKGLPYSFFARSTLNLGFLLSINNNTHVNVHVDMKTWLAVYNTYLGPGSGFGDPFHIQHLSATHPLFHADRYSLLELFLVLDQEELAMYMIGSHSKKVDMGKFGQCIHHLSAERQDKYKEAFNNAKYRPKSLEYKGEEIDQDIIHMMEDLIKEEENEKSKRRAKSNKKKKKQPTSAATVGTPTKSPMKQYPQVQQQQQEVNHDDGEDEEKDDDDFVLTLNTNRVTTPATTTSTTTATTQSKPRQVPTRQNSNGSLSNGGGSKDTPTKRPPPPTKRQNSKQNLLSQSPTSTTTTTTTTTPSTTQHHPPLTIQTQWPSIPTNRQQQQPLTPHKQHTQATTHNGDTLPSPGGPPKIVSPTQLQSMTRQTVNIEELECKVGKFRFSRKESHIIGRGSNGTLVFRGIWNERIPVAVKQMQKAFNSLISKEIQVLIQLTDSNCPNIVRYIDQEEDDMFVYLGITLCDLSLQELVEDSRHHHLLASLRQEQMISDIVEGVRFLHSHNIVHNDLNPRNILFKDGHLLISDMGLSKMLIDSSFTFTHSPSGQGGYHPAEVLLQQRKTSAVDIFSLGCLIHYILSGGGHPFGDKLFRVTNILMHQHIQLTSQIHDNNMAVDLITTMIRKDADQRPTITQVQKHPLFWTVDHRLKFIDRVNQAVKKYPLKYLNYNYATTPLVGITAPYPGDTWDSAIDAQLLKELTQGVAVAYKFDMTKDLIRCIRNAIHHHQDIFVDKIKRLHYFDTEQAAYQYFEDRLPNLLLYLYQRLGQVIELVGSPYLSEFYV